MREAGRKYFTGGALLVDPGLEVLFTSFDIAAFFFLNAGFFGLLLGARALARVVVGFHQALLALLFFAFVIELFIGGFEEGKGWGFNGVGFFAYVELAGFFYLAVEVRDELVQLSFRVEVIRFEGALEVAFGEGGGFETEVAVVFELLLGFDKLGEG